MKDNIKIVNNVSITTITLSFDLDPHSPCKCQSIKYDQNRAVKAFNTMIDMEELNAIGPRLAPIVRSVECNLNYVPDIPPNIV